MALTEIYVDPSLAADSGTGTIGDPYGDLEYAIEQETFDTTNGTRVNIKAGTDEVLAADLTTALADVTTSVAWAPSLTAPLVFQGYLSAAGDGGIGGISAATSGTIINSTTLDFISFKDLHLHTAGYTNQLITLDDFCAVINCELNNANTCVILGNVGVISGCYFHDFDTYGPFAASDSIIENNIIDSSEKACVAGTATTQAGVVFERNIISVNGGEYGIIASTGAVADSNSIFSVAGTVSGIFVSTSTAFASIKNNIIEGFSGAGGHGINMSANSGCVVAAGGNSFYNCETNANYNKGPYLRYGDDETLASSAFTDTASLNFNPVDVGSVKEGAIQKFFTIV